MKNLKTKFNTAMILITHNLGVVAKFCENVAVVYAGEVIERGSVDDVFSRKRNHPYTEGLFQSIPDLTTDAERLTPIAGIMADPTNLPQGCKFAARCAYHTERCAGEEPPLFASGNHEIKCFKYAGKGGKEP
jgi:peptide/nickel transport system ATP-binding protein